MFIFFGVIVAILFFFSLCLYDRFLWWKLILSTSLVAVSVMFFIFAGIANSRGVEITEKILITNQLKLGSAVIYFQEPVEIEKSYIDYPFGASKESIYNYAITEIE